MDVKVGEVVDISEIPAAAKAVRGGGKYAAVYEKFEALPPNKSLPFEFPDAKLALKAAGVLRQRIRQDGGVVVVRGRYVWIGRPAGKVKAVEASS